MTPLEPLTRDEAERRYAGYVRAGARRRRTRRGVAVAGGVVGTVAVVAALVWAASVLRGMDRGQQPAAPVAKLGAPAVLSIGSDNLCALTPTRGVRCWGRSAGTGHRGFAASPVDVVGLEQGVRGLAAGWGFTCALLDDDSLSCWGRNDAGQLGDGSTYTGSEPVTPIGLPSVRAVAAGGGHTCAITQDRTAWCWGANGWGQLGDGTEVQRSVPGPVRGLDAGVVDIASGYQHSCALLDDGAVRCWGANERGQLGDRTTERRSLPVAVAGLPPTVAIEAGAGADHTCALTVEGTVWCWGANEGGSLGVASNVEFRSSPVQIQGLPGPVSTIAVSEFNACAITDEGAAYCWGDPEVLGRSTIFDSGSTEPVLMEQLPRAMAAFAIGNTNGCVLSTDGTLRCWGQNGDGQLGTGTEGGSRLFPRELPGRWYVPDDEGSGA
jgi:alpha-tubulin suppressor-like RCC1 family protein